MEYPLDSGERHRMRFHNRPILAALTMVRVDKEDGKEMEV
jgi:hypothetical protein